MRACLAFLVIAALAACSSHETPPAQASPAYTTYAAPAAATPAAAPVIVQTAAPAQSGMSDMLLAGAAGYMLGNANNSQGAHTGPGPSRTVVHKTVINKTVAYAAPPPTPKPSMVKAPIKAAPSFAPRSSYASTAGNSSYRASASPIRKVSYSAPPRTYARASSTTRR